MSVEDAVADAAMHAHDLPDGGAAFHSDVMCDYHFAIGRLTRRDRSPARPVTDEERRAIEAVVRGDD